MKVDCKEVRREICKGCKYKNKRHPDACTIYEQSSIDYHKKSCKWKSSIDKGEQKNCPDEEGLT